MNAVGDYAAARSLAKRALDSAGTPETRVAGHSLLATLAWFGGDAATAARRLEQALAEATGDRRLEGPAYAKLVRFNFTLDFERAVERADTAMRLLREEDEPLRLGHVLIDRFFGGALLGRPAPRALLERGLELEARALPTGAEPPHPVPLIWFWCTDELQAARARHVMEDEWYGDRGEELWQANRRAHVAPIELRAGNWELAERYVEENCSVLQRAEVGGPMLLAFEKRALVDAHLGRVDRA